PGTLRWAVAQAQGGDTIDIWTTTPIVLTHGELVLARDLTIGLAAFTAPGTQATISGDHLSRIFEVTPAAHVNLFDLHLLDGTVVANNPSGTTGDDGDGGAILNYGTLALTRCTLSDNAAFNGGGILNAGFLETSLSTGVNTVGALTLTNCQL